MSVSETAYSSLFKPWLLKKLTSQIYYMGTGANNKPSHVSLIITTAIR
jgi:hypothetical protein